LLPFVTARSGARVRAGALAFAILVGASFSAPLGAPLSTPLGAQSSSAKKILTLADYGRWSRITSTSLSGDGHWAAYIYQPNDGDGTLHIKQLDGDKQYAIPLGSAPAFSDDSRFAVYYVSPPERAAGAAAVAGRGGRPGAPGVTPPGVPSGVPPAVPPAVPQAGGGAAVRAAVRRLELLNLASGEKSPIPNAATFKFSKGSRWLAVRLNKADATAKQNGADLIVRDLTSGSARNIGNVNLYDFDDAGRLLAYTVDAVDRLGNGIYLLDPASSESRALNTESADFDQIAWSADGAALAVLRGDKPKDSKQKVNALLAWTGVGSASPTFTEYDPASDASFPKGVVLSEFAQPRWSKDRSRIFIGLKDQEAEPPSSTEPKANVDVWHWKDPEPQSVQMVQIAQERRSTLAAALFLDGKRLVRLADSSMRTVQPVSTGKWVVGRLDAPYRGEVSWGGSRADLYRVNSATAERTLIAKGLTRTYGASPDGRWFLFLQNKHVFAFDLENGKNVALDSKAGRSFVDEDDDHPYEKPIYGVAGWSKDGTSVLLYDKYDVFQIALDGGAVTNLTSGVGRAQQIQFRVVRFGAAGRVGRGGRGGGGAAVDEDEGIDLAKPLLLSAYGDRTKKSGYWQVVAGESPKSLIYEDKSIGAADKAANADRVLFTQQSFTEFPDVWVTNTTFTAPRRVTDANPQLADYAWGKKVLIDFVNSKGNKLQGTLTLPANYEPGKKYPMIVYFYEIVSNTHNQFSMPVYDDRPHMSTYASQGYLVFQPDVVYEIGRPGSSAVDCVTSAVRKVIALGYADPKHIGLQGHSWGGYQSSYIVTQTDMFAAVVTGAPPADLTSFYDQLYKRTGTVQQGIMEIGQVRMGANVTPWTAHELYESQSPVHNVQKIKTPFLILQGTADGAVDWMQGLEWFNAARRNGKNVIFLSYPDEPHHLAKKENQKDFQIRMKQYFDHYLKDAPPPKWMTDGVPQIRKGGPSL
jgi:dienelactone hydrolase